MSCAPFPILPRRCGAFWRLVVYDLAVESSRTRNCFLDVSSSMAYLWNAPHKRALQDIRRRPESFSNSDFPMWDPAEELEVFSSIDFTDEEFEKMTWHTAEHYLGFKLG